MVEVDDLAEELLDPGGVEPDRADLGRERQRRVGRDLGDAGVEGALPPGPGLVQPLPDRQPAEPVCGDRGDPGAALVVDRLGLVKGKVANQVRVDLARAAGVVDRLPGQAEVQRRLRRPRPLDPLLDPAEDLFGLLDFVAVAVDLAQQQRCGQERVGAAGALQLGQPGDRVIGFAFDGSAPRPGEGEGEGVRQLGHLSASFQSKMLVERQQQHVAPPALVAVVVEVGDPERIGERAAGQAGGDLGDLDRSSRQAVGGQARSGLEASVGDEEALVGLADLDQVLVEERASGGDPGVSQLDCGALAVADRAVRLEEGGLGQDLVVDRARPGVDRDVAVVLGRDAERELDAAGGEGRAQRRVLGERLLAGDHRQPDGGGCVAPAGEVRAAVVDQLEGELAATALDVRLGLFGLDPDAAPVEGPDKAVVNRIQGEDLEGGAAGAVLAEVDREGAGVGDEYERLVAAIRRYPSCQAMYSLWLIRTDRTVADVLNELWAQMDPSDRLLVADVTGDVMGWLGLDSEVAGWIMANNPAR